MKYTKLGNTGLDVSHLCLGCMGFGRAGNWPHNSWSLDEASARPVIQKALELGINFFDTANVYASGNSEEILGRALKTYASRDEIVIATKVFSPMNQKPNGKGLSRKAILSEMDKSLKRLETDYVDLYIIHRWDYTTPIAETMETLHDLVKAGKTRYIGASSMFAWQLQQANLVAEKNGWTKFVSMQNHLNLLYREEEREMIPYCKSENIALTPYSPLASGRLTRDLSEQTERGTTDAIAKNKYDTTADADKMVIERVASLAEKFGVERVEIALAWLLQKQPVTIPVIGATKFSHLEKAIPALDIQLTTADVAFLEEPYVPHKIVGHQ